MADRREQAFNSDRYNREYFEGHLLRYKGPVYGQRVQHVTKYLGDPAGMHVLDLGCGVGFFSDLCLGRGARVTSMDFSLDALRFCREEYGDRLTLTRGDASALPFRDNVFDWVLMNDIIEHLTPEVGRGMLEEARRVLRQGGRCLLDTDNERFLMNRRGFRRLNWILQRNTPQQKALDEIKSKCKASSLHVKIYDVAELRRLLLDVGFEIEAFEVYPYIAIPLRDALFNLPVVRSLMRNVKGDVQIYCCRKA